MAKTLQPGSKYSNLDINNDGTVSDEELQALEKIHEIERLDRKQRQQRYMAWTAMWSMVIFTAAILSPIVPEGRVELMATLLSTFYIAQAGIVGAFMGFAAIADKNANARMK